MKIVIIGCGRMGSGLAANLIRSDHEVTVVDCDPLAFNRLGGSFPGERIIGDALDKEVFTRSRITRADALAAVTGNDTVNTVVARAARELFRVPKVVARIHDPLNAEVYRRLGIQTITNVELGIVRLSELLTFSSLDIMYSLGTGEVGVIVLEVHPDLSGHTISDITLAGEIQVISITRNGRTFIPLPGTALEWKDIVHVVVEAGSVPRLRSLLGQGGG